MSTAVIEAETELTLDQMLAAFDPKLHGGEVMAGGAVGVEAFADGDAQVSSSAPRRFPSATSVGKITWRVTR